MTNSRALIARFAIPLAATALVLTACGSSTAGDEAEPAAATSAAAEAMESKESEAMESKESEAMESKESDEMHSDDMASASAEPAAAASGAYITLAQYEGSKDMYAEGDVVLFFAADWCPTCQTTTKNLEADPAAIPAGLAIVRVDYDNSDELKQQYGVTTQHTFVQVDADGNEVAKWTGSLTADEIAEQTA
jgi:thiol-disulfide isomerase/thioredoxin